MTWRRRYRRRRLLAVRYHALADGNTRRAEWAKVSLRRLDANQPLPRR